MPKASTGENAGRLRYLKAAGDPGDAYIITFDAVLSQGAHRSVYKASGNILVKTGGYDRDSEPVAVQAALHLFGGGVSGVRGRAGF
ncbi:MAG: hypothetical protein C1O27_002415 [Chloroflexi bacterium]|jgi:hypothetical protein|nr:MAG: hypothetical protein C1O27_002415 [Chloroflexota bacterium]